MSYTTHAVSLKYLTLSEATALNFLGPLGSLILARWLAFANVRWTDCLGAAGALVGVVLVAQPEAVFGVRDDGALSHAAAVDVDLPSRDHFKGIAFGILGVGGVIVSCIPFSLLS